MPFIKIFIDKSISKDTKETISNSIHLALVECFNIPLKDKFQVFIEVDKDNMIFPDEYLACKYSNILFINIFCKNGRTKEQKKCLYKNIADKILQNSSIKKDDIFITIIENSEDNWSFGNGIAQLMELSYE
ncbi:tautomerase family protein [Aliarcobacter cryaerophilus]|uniref:tautomerase family protein n=1 Tax=Aliarcobacter cryaerophilus TaxID=28198 RepID=UPI0021B30B31|nr:tautomerase family protein [Aliarcobacter cryaerophilus]MCT7488189.1 tautomerase family protein [Aliarcobacter cryaerophilus]MCT7505314.1 tautomerase family protein [Aliarcobacter cryaerophilus]